MVEWPETFVSQPMSKYLIDSNVFTALFALLGALAAWVNPDAAVGASAGAMFFLLSSEEKTAHKKIGYFLISLCVGYSVGLTASEGWAMLLSAGAASTGVVTLSTLTKKIDSGDFVGAVKMLIELARSRK